MSGTGTGSGGGGVISPVSSGGGSGTVTSVAAADTSVVIGGTPTVAPTVRTNTLDVVAAQHPPAADWSNNSHKITSLASGTAASDAAASTQVWGAQGWGVTPAGLGLAMLSNPPQLCPNQANCTDKQQFCVLVTCVQSVTLSHIGCYLQQAGITPGTGINGMAIYAEAGGAALATSSDMTVAMESTGYVEGTLSLAVTAGTNYYIALLTSFSGTIPKVNAVQTTLAAVTLFNGHYIGGTLAAQSSFGSLTPSGLSASNDTWCMWAR